MKIQKIEIKSSSHKRFFLDNYGTLWETVDSPSRLKAAEKARNNIFCPISSRKVSGIVWHPTLVCKSRAKYIGKLGKEFLT